MMATPCSRRSRMMRTRASNSRSLMAEVGSSMMITSDRCARALAISTVCISATVRSPIRAEAETEAPSRPSRLWASRCRACRSIQPGRPRTGSCPMKMFSATDSSGNGSSSWWIMAMPSLKASWGERSRTGRPLKRICPASGVCSPIRIRMRVDLPAPFSPITAWTVPGMTVRSTASSAFTPGKDFDRPFTSNTGRLSANPAMFFAILGSGRTMSTRYLRLAGLSLGCIGLAIRACEGLGAIAGRAKKRTSPSVEMFSVEAVFVLCWQEPARCARMAPT